MNGAYRFRETHGGVTAFAHVTVQSESGVSNQVQWDDGLAMMRQVWGGDIEKEIKQATDAHQRQGGSPHAVVVVAVVDLPVDTKSDAMACAAAIATWLSLGHDEAEAKVVLEAGSWKVAFRDV